MCIIQVNSLEAFSSDNDADPTNWGVSDVFYTVLRLVMYF